jgi:hypothetical protein
MKLFEKKLLNHFNKSDDENNISLKINLFNLLGNSAGQISCNGSLGVANFLRHDRPLFLFGKNDYLQHYSNAKNLFNNLAGFQTDDDKSYRGIFFVDNDRKDKQVYFPKLNYPVSFSYLYDFISSSYTKLATFKDNYFCYYSFSNYTDAVFSYGFMIVITCETIGYLTLLEILSSGNFTINTISFQYLLDNIYPDFSNKIFSNNLYIVNTELFGKNETRNFPLSNYISPDTFQAVSNVPIALKMTEKTGLFLPLPYDFNDPLQSGTYTENSFLIKLNISKNE